MADYAFYPKALWDQHAGPLLQGRVALLDHLQELPEGEHLLFIGDDIIPSNNKSALK